MQTTLFSIAILNRTIASTTLQNLIESLKNHYAYFEILLINPIFSTYNSPPPIDSLDCFKPTKTPLSSPHSSLAPHLRILEVKALDTSMYYHIFLQNCIGDYLLFVDLETQSIADCLAMLKKAVEYDIIIGVRKTKRQSLIQRLISKAFYATLKLCVRREINSTYSESCALNRKVIHFLLKQNEPIKLLRILAFDTSFSKYEYAFTPIAPSKPKNFLHSLHLSIDIVFQNSYKLLRLATLTSLSMAVVNFLYMFYILLSFLSKENIERGWTSSSLYMVLMQFCLFLVLSIFGEYMRVILLHFKRKDTYQIIDETSSLSLKVHQKNIKDS